jgi:hypothetical protein
VNVHALPQAVPIPLFGQFIGDDGIFRPNVCMMEGTTGMLDELAKWTLVLKPMRVDATA